MKKKNIILIILLMMVLCYVPNVFAVSAKGCENAGLSVDVKIVNLVSTIILVIQIAVPVVLVIMGSMDLFKGITAQKEDEIKKGQQILIKRLIAAALVFFVIAAVKLIMGLVTSDDENVDYDGKILPCFNCFLKGADKSSGTCN